MNARNAQAVSVAEKRQTLFTIPIMVLLAFYQLIPVSGESYTVLGSVKDVNGNPLSYVAVTIYDYSGAFITRTWTLLNGNFAVSLDARATGFSWKREAMRVRL